MVTVPSLRCPVTFARCSLPVAHSRGSCLCLCLCPGQALHVPYSHCPPVIALLSGAVTQERTFW